MYRLLRCPRPPRHSTGAVARLLDSARGALDVIYREMIKFGVVGLIAFVIDLGLGEPALAHRALRQGDDGYIISGAVATLFAWFGNRQDLPAPAQPSAYHEVALFFGVNAIALGISAVTLFVSHYGYEVYVDPGRQRRDDHRHRAGDAVPVLGVPQGRLRRRAALTRPSPVVGALA